MKTDFEVQLQFSITQHIRDCALMLQFIQFCNCGYIAADGPLKVQYRIRGISQIENHLLPFLVENPLLTRKSLDLIDFIKVFEIMKAKNHLTMGGIQTIREIQSNMNSRRI
jgi:LAGLIDADG endonuclease